MARKTTSLETLERWMLEVVRHPADVRTAIDSPRARRIMPVSSASIEDVILPSKSLSAIDRLAVYSNGYFARLLEILEKNFPTVREIAGEQAFRSLAARYLDRHPSRYYNLNRLGRKFPAFLARSKEPIPHRAALAEVAAIEDAIDLVFDAKRSEAVTVEEWERFPAGRWADARITLIPALRLFECAFDVNAWMTRAAEKKKSRAPAKKTTFVLVYRKEWIVRRAALDRFEYTILTALAKKMTLGAALESAITAAAVPEKKLISVIRTSFRRLAAMGIFARLS